MTRQSNSSHSLRKSFVCITKDTPSLIRRDCLLTLLCYFSKDFKAHQIKWCITDTGDEAFKSICRVLGPLTKNPTLGVQHAVEAGYLFKEHASISAWLFTFLSYCEVTKPLSRIKTITRMRRIYKRRLVIAGFIISALHIIHNFFFLKILMVQLVSFQKFFVPTY